MVIPGGQSMKVASIKKIMVIEDEPDILTIITMSLESVGGYLTRACNSGFEALDVIREYKPDLILLDVMMPGMNGPMTLKAIHEIPEFADVPVIFITAKAQAQELSNYREMGAIDIIIKPFDPMSLPDMIRGILEKYYE